MTTFGSRLYASFLAQSQATGRKVSKEEFIELANRQWAIDKKERKRAAINPDAERVYALYPKKSGKEDALRAITKALEKHPLEYLLDKTSQFAACVAAWPSSYRYFQDGGDRCWNPANFYNDGHYEDDQTTWKRSGAKNAPPQSRIPPEPEGWREALEDLYPSNRINEDKIAWGTFYTTQPDIAAIVIQKLQHSA